jgi:hypothetical protein
MVPCSKKPAHGEISANKICFNIKVAKPHVKSEHCIGYLNKVRFQFLKEICILAESKNDTGIIIHLIMVWCILHNNLIDEKNPDCWYSPDIYNSEEEIN